MAIFSAPTTITPFSGKVLDTPVVLHYDSDKMVLSSLIPQPEDDTKSYFEYELSKNAKGRPITAVAYVNATVDEIITAITPSSAPTSLTIDYVSPINGIGTFTFLGQVSVSFTLSTPNTGTQVWAIENIVNPTGAGNIDGLFDTGDTVYFGWEKGVPTSSGTVTFDVRLTIGALTTTKPCSVIIVV
jgi:hypothetical protein